jgi:hypothetical protein
MRQHLTKMPTPATVLAALALFVALAGTSVAAISALPRGSVGTTQLRTNAVTSKKILNNTIVSADVRNGTLLRADFRPGQLPAGAQGPAGPQGPPGIAGLERRDVVTPSSSANTKTLSAVCPTGKRVIGGGARVTGSGVADVTINESFPDSDGTKWNATARESDATIGSWVLQVYALCATVAS